MVSEVVVSPFCGRKQRPCQRCGTEQVITHRGEGESRAVRHGLRMTRFFLEPANALVAVSVDDSETGSIFKRHLHCCNAHVGVLFQVKCDHLPNVHSVHVIRGKNRNQVRGLPADPVETVIYRVGGAAERGSLRSVVGKNRNDEFTRRVRHCSPGSRDVVQQHPGPILCQHVGAAQPRIVQIAQYEIDNAMAAPEPQRRFG
jgi:hypothetical protein